MLAANRTGEFAKTSGNMLSKEIKATVAMEAQATGYRAENTVFVNEHGGLELAQSSEIKSFVYHGKELLSGREDFTDATIGMVTDVACAKTEEYITSIVDEGISSGTIKIVESTTNVVIEKTNDEVIRQLMERVSGNAGKIAVIVAKAGKYFIQCIAGEMTVDQFIVSSIKTGCDIANTIVGAEIGRHAGEMVGGAIGSLVLPGIGTEIGVIIGHFVGEFVGALLGSEFLNICLSFRSEADIFLESQRELAYEIDKHTYQLVKELTEIHIKHETTIMNAFNELLGSMVVSDYEKMNKAIGMIAEEFGFQLAYDNQDDFDSFMLDDSQTLKIGRTVIQ